MNTRRCPYPDERQGRWMNVSALAQITARLDDVLADVVAFRSHLGAPPSWHGVAVTVLDRMAAPALHLLDAGTWNAPVPVLDAIGYKVAVGYSSPVRAMFIRELRGDPIPVTVADFHREVRASRSLVGAREVCAAPNNMLDRVTGAFLCGPGDAPERSIGRRRREIAELLGAQFRLGLEWERVDQLEEQRLILRSPLADQLRPRTPFLERSLEERRGELSCLLGDNDAAVSSRRDRRALDAATRAILAAAQRTQAPIDVVAEGESRTRIAGMFADYLAAYCAHLRRFHELELAIRELLDLPERCSGPVKTDRGLLPTAKCLRWFELTTGQRLRLTDRPVGLPLVLNSTQGSTTLPSTLWSASAVA